MSLLTISRLVIIALVLIIGIIVGLKDRSLNSHGKELGIGSLVIIVLALLAETFIKSSVFEIVITILALLLAVSTGICLNHYEEKD